MSTVYKLPYTGNEIKEKIGQVDKNTTHIGELSEQIGTIKSDRVDVNGETTEIDETPLLEDWLDGQYYIESGEPQTSEYTTEYRAIKLKLSANSVYHIYFNGTYVIYDENGVNGKTVSKHNDDVLELTTEESIYIALNHQKYAFNYANVYVHKVNTEIIGYELKNLILTDGQKSPLKNKVIVNFGDSIFGQSRPPYDVSTFLSEISGATVYNCGFGGCQMGEHAQSKYDAFSMYRLVDSITSNDWTLQDNALKETGLPDYYAETLALLKSIDFSKVDDVTIGYGINDFLNGLKPRTTSTTNQFIGFGNAMEYSIEKLLASYPHIKVFVCLMTYLYDDNEDSDTIKNTSWVDSNEYTYLSFIEEQKNVSKKYHLPIIDNYDDLGINKANRTHFFSNGDGVHHNTNGRMRIAENMAKKIY